MAGAVPNDGRQGSHEGVMQVPQHLIVAVLWTHMSG